MKEWVIVVGDEIAEPLHDALSRETSNEISFLVGQIDGLKIEIFANEHPPPHFRVLYQGASNTFRISDCAPMHGDDLRRFFKQIREWHAEHKPRLIQTWNERRPANCPVGLYREPDGTSAKPAIVSKRRSAHRGP